MQNVIEFPRKPSHSGGPSAGSIGDTIEALSRTLDQIRMLCELMPHGPIREQLKAEQVRLIVGLSAARQTAAQLSSLGAPMVSSSAADHPLALTY